jgi:integrase
MDDLPKVIRELENDLDIGGKELIDGSRLSFREVADRFKEERLIPAKILNGKKVEGLRDTRIPNIFLSTLMEHFGRLKIGSITYKQVKDFKAKRLKTPTNRKGERSETSVNRELQMLRQVFKYAMQQGWILRNPMTMGQPLINVANENERIRVLTFEEEAKLLAVCVEPRQHLRALIVIGIDTFIRLGELYRLKKKDVNFADRYITVLSENSKVFRERIVGLTPRAHAELEHLTKYLGPDDPLFQFGSARRSWATACRKAKVKDAKMADLRDTGITRRLEAVVRARLPWQIVMKESGHTQIKTFMRYFNPRIELLVKGAEAMERLPGALNAFDTEAAGVTLHSDILDSAIGYDRA